MLAPAPACLLDRDFLLLAKLLSTWAPAGGLRRALIPLVAWLWLGGCGQNIDCQPGGTNCSGACVSLVTDAANCGICGLHCRTDEYCTQADCRTYCGAGQSNCDGSCLPTANDPSHCGGCETACDGGEYCDAGKCSDSCSGVLCKYSGEKRCVHLADDPQHCGGCNQPCDAGQECRHGECRAACAEGREDCSGVCVDLDHDPANCGQCGNGCDLGVSCHSGICGGPKGCSGEDCSCAKNETICDATCVDTQTDADNCGKCAAACFDGQSCRDGTCVCPDGLDACGTTCADLQSDDANCGACGAVCKDGSSCANGACTCPGGDSYCAAKCVDPLTSREHCGTCGFTCAASETCKNGVCYAAADDGCGGRARDVNISGISWYQAVEVPLFDGSNLVGSDQRTAPIVVGKASMLRVHVDVAGGFAGRQLSARLWLGEPGKPGTLHYQKRDVSADSKQADLATTFNIDVPAAELSAQTAFHVELVECDQAPTGTIGTTRVPTTGEADLSARTTGPIHIAFVPVLYNGLLPDTSDATLAIYTAEALGKFPTTGFSTEVRPAYGNYSSPTSLDTILTDLEGKRGSDDPADDVYYYGLVHSHATEDDYCNAVGASDCVLGIAFVSTAPSKHVAVGVAYGDTDSAATFAHELGHNHGRSHSPNGGASDADPNYPYAEGKIGVWGYSLVAAKLKSPASTFDFMGYADPNWTSDYTFSGIADAIANTNGVAARLATKKTLWDAIHVGTRGVRFLPSRTTNVVGLARDTAIVYDSAGVEVETIDVYRADIADSSGYMLFMPPRQPDWHALLLNDGVVAVYP